MNAIDAPERIWAGEDAIFTRRWREDDQNGGTEYIRADLASPQPANPAQVMDASRVADALEACDWSGPSIGNKAILQKAAELLRSAAIGAGEPVAWAFRNNADDLFQLTFEEPDVCYEKRPLYTAPQPALAVMGLEPLGADFEAVWDKNAAALYESDPVASPQSAGMVEALCDAGCTSDDGTMVIAPTRKVVAALSSAPATADGWRMTPRMAEAGKAKLIELGYTDVEFTDAQKVFEAMIAAAPTATGGR